MTIALYFFLFILLFGAISYLTYKAVMRWSDTPQQIIANLWAPFAFILVLIPIFFYSGFLCFMECSSPDVARWLGFQMIFLFSYPIIFFIGLALILRFQTSNLMTKIGYGAIYLHIILILISTLVGNRLNAIAYGY